MADPRADAGPGSACWADREGHRRWLLAEGQRLLDHYARARVPAGFATLGNDGTMVDATAQGIVTTRMVHCYALASLMGVPGAAPLADHGMNEPQIDTLMFRHILQREHVLLAFVPRFV